MLLFASGMGNSQTVNLASMTLSVRQALQEAMQQLADHVDDAYTDSHVLMSHCLQKDRAWLIAHADDELAGQAADSFSQLIEQRQQGVPVAHLMGIREFWSRTFQVTPDTLIPRPETELLIEQTLALVAPTSGLKVLDFGTGSGVIAVTLACEHPDWQLSALDCSAEALQVARRNAQTHATDIDFIEACSLEVLSDKKFDLIVSNPPYIAADDPHLQQGDVRFEPPMALASGHDGLDCIRRLISEAPRSLEPAAYLIMEHGYDQGEAVRHLLQDQGYIEIHTEKDLAGHDRVTSARWAG